MTCVAGVCSCSWCCHRCAGCGPACGQSGLLEFGADYGEVNATVCSPSTGDGHSLGMAEVISNPTDKKATIIDVELIGPTLLASVRWLAVTFASGGREHRDVFLLSCRWEPDF